MADEIMADAGQVFDFIMEQYGLSDENIATQDVLDFIDAYRQAFIDASDNGMVNINNLNEGQIDSLKPIIDWMGNEGLSEKDEGIGGNVQAHFNLIVGAAENEVNAKDQDAEITISLDDILLNGHDSFEEFQRAEEQENQEVNPLLAALQQAEEVASLMSDLISHEEISPADINFVKEQAVENDRGIV